MVTNQVERRILSAKITLRAATSAASPGTIQGYAALYNSRSEDLGGFVEQLMPGAFDKVVASKPDVKCLMNHDSNIVLGRTTSGTLQVLADRKGLWYSCILPNTSAGRDIHALIQRQDISQCSFAFSLDPGDDEWTEETDSRTGKKRGLRTIRNVSRLMDCSPVTNPAYKATSVSALLTPQDFSSMPKISDRALAECRRLGIQTYTPRRVVLVDEEDRDWILRETARKNAAMINADNEKV